MPSLTKQIAQELMEKFKNENPEIIMKIIQDIRVDIAKSNRTLNNEI
jgi:hypothetical protein